MKYKYIGENQVSFEYGNLYEAYKDNDDQMGDFYAIKDESGEWYCYSIDFFEANFEAVELEKQAV